MEKYTDFSKKLGKGSFGSVKLVQRNQDKKLLAMKIIDLATEEAAKTAYNEPNILETLQHPNIVKFYETFVLKDSLHLVMEYCEQGDLQQKVRQALSEGEYLPEEQILEWFVQVLLATKHLHDHRIIHRDIKVHNVFLTSDGLVKLGDFGISKQLENTGDLGRTWLGTPFYVSPEMLSHCVSSYKSDTWMLGCLLYELCTLEKPFPGDNISVVMRNIMFEDYLPIPEHYSSLIHNLIKGLLEKNPEKRLSIGQIFEIQGVKEQVNLLYNKYPQVYPVELAQNAVKISPIALEFSDTIRDLASKAQAATENKSPLTDSQDSSRASMLELNTVRIKSKNIRALVEQRKATLSPSSADKMASVSTLNTPFPTTQHNINRAGSVQVNTFEKQDQSEIIKPVRVVSMQLEKCDLVWGEQKIAPTVNLWEEKNIHQNSCGYEEFKQDEKIAGYPLKKHPNIFIDIPIGTEQSESQSQISTEKAQPNNRCKSAMNNVMDSSPVPTTKVEGIKKSFGFADYIFDRKLPNSPNRTFWVSQFLKQKLGGPKFEQVKTMMENSANPTQLLREQPEKVLQIIGNDKKDCLVMLNFLISHTTNSVTPTGVVKGTRVCNTGRNLQSYRPGISTKSFISSAFPCATEPDSATSRSPLVNVRVSRRNLSEVFKPRQKDEPLSACLPGKNH